MIIVLLKGFLIGWLISLPMGPIGVLCVQRTLSSGRISGIVSGMGAAAADTLFALIAGYGVNYVVGFIEEKKFLFEIISSSVLMAFGLKVYFTNTVKQFRRSKGGKYDNLSKKFFSVFFLTLTNPIMILWFVWLFAILNIVLNTSNYVLSSFLILGVYGGAAVWWIILANIVNRFRNNLRMRRLYWLNKIAGSIIILFGIYFLISALIYRFL